MEIEDVVRKVTDTLVSCSLRLIALEREIRAAQPIVDGAVLLELHYHKPTCLGCPHVVWKQWKGHRYHPTRKWQAHVITNPLKRLPRGENVSDLRPLVHEAIRIQRVRSLLVRDVSVMYRRAREADKSRV